jgi:hypothetical protein
MSIEEDVYLCDNGSISDNDSNDSNDSSNSNNSNNNYKLNKILKKNKKRVSEKMDIKEAVKTIDERALYVKIDRYFKKNCNVKQIEKMIKIINNQDSISLRLLNWFAMKHSATMEALEVKDQNNNITLFDIKISYKARLWTHSKKYFDPFRRGKRFDYHYNNKLFIETTLCQLNFFRWLFLHNLMTYVEDHFDELKSKMGRYEKKKKEIKIKKNNKTIVKTKKKDFNFKVKRFTNEDDSKLVIII